MRGWGWLSDDGVSAMNVTTLYDDGHHSSASHDVPLAIFGDNVSQETITKALDLTARIAQTRESNQR